MLRNSFGCAFKPLLRDNRASAEPDFAQSCHRGINRRPQVFADHGIDLPKFVVQWGRADAQRHGLSDGGFFLPRPLAFARVAAPSA
ncbi:MAG: hypothetical protein RI957_1743 [Verrucomicrobiota bacterium]